MTAHLPDPVLFLDIDDVLCLSVPYGGFDALDAVNQRHPDAQAVFRELFASRARRALERVHNSMSGRLRYVISSTWREFFSRDQLEAVFRQAGLAFVADALEEEGRWRTPVEPTRGHRSDEIAQWLAEHHRGEPFAVVDDTYSGWTLRPAQSQTAHTLADRVVLCEERVGLRDHHVEFLVAALRREASAKLRAGGVVEETQ